MNRFQSETGLIDTLARIEEKLDRLLGEDKPIIKSVTRDSVRRQAALAAHAEGKRRRAAREELRQ